MIPLTECNQPDAVLTRESAKKALNHFKSSGCLWMKGVFDRQHIDEIRDQLNEICGDLKVLHRARMKMLYRLEIVG